MTTPFWAIRGGELPLASPLVMGVLNLTPDSFSDGGGLPDIPSAVALAERMVEEGAGVLDLGGESTRPGARPVPEGEEIRRVVPVVGALSLRVGVPLSVDTRKASVARAAVEAGASIVNDVSALAFDPAMGEVIAESDAGVVLMHMRGTPEDMRERASYREVEKEVAAELSGSVDRALSAGIRRESIVLDPGIGFAKSGAQSLRLLGRLAILTELGYPVLVGPSRKSFLGEILGVPPRERVVGTAAACLMAYLAGARIFRVHDVAATAQALTVARAIEEAGREAAAGPGEV